MGEGQRAAGRNRGLKTNRVVVNGGQKGEMERDVRVQGKEPKRGTIRSMEEPEQQKSEG